MQKKLGLTHFGGEN